MVSLNGVRPRRPEQSGPGLGDHVRRPRVSMESGLEDRNNPGCRPRSPGP